MQETRLVTVADLPGVPYKPPEGPKAPKLGGADRSRRKKISEALAQRSAKPQIKMVKYG